MFYKGKVKAIRKMVQRDKVLWNIGDEFRFIVNDIGDNDFRIKIYNPEYKDWVNTGTYKKETNFIDNWFTIINEEEINEKDYFYLLNENIELSLREVLAAPQYSQFILEGGSDLIYEMRQSLVILNDSEIGCETPAITLELLNSTFKLR